jgi:hypothetical protein
MVGVVYVGVAPCVRQTSTAQRGVPREPAPDFLFVAGAGVYLVSIGIAFINPYLCLGFHGALALCYARDPASRRLEHDRPG